MTHYVIPLQVSSGILVQFILIISWYSVQICILPVLWMAKYLNGGFLGIFSSLFYMIWYLFEFFLGSLKMSYGSLCNREQGAPWSWKVMELRKTIFQAWKVMENGDNVVEFLLLHWAIL